MSSNEQQHDQVSRSEESIGEQIAEFVRNCDQNIDRFVVEGEDYDEVKEYAERVGGDGFSGNWVIEGVPVYWKGDPHSGIEARIKVSDSE